MIIIFNVYSGYVNLFVEIIQIHAITFYFLLNTG